MKLDDGGDALLFTGGRSYSGTWQRNEQGAFEFMLVQTSPSAEAGEDSYVDCAARASVAPTHRLEMIRIVT
ncbi:hypothetical protein M3650_25985 [Paenibacillus sp. MER TA 81-3]|uniref:hypothetical protein n=1 Tax=Paenibacillus sp. MER TA 81-3 TaxID=2939573 RepID=UPI0034D960D5|nr:hypothetical protein [Paenibacillus sp. MER TA 81-3]